MIEIRNLTKRYGDFTAVDDLNLTVDRGEIFGFLGPNGAGKTTTIRILAGLSLPTSGDVRVDGIDVVAEPVRGEGDVGYIPDRPYLYEKLTGRELLQFVANLYRPRVARLRAARARPARLLRPSRLDRRAHREPLARDEAEARDRLRARARPVAADHRRADGRPRRARAAAGEAALPPPGGREEDVFLTTHTLSVAEAVCDRIAILHRGKIVATGRTQSCARTARSKMFSWS